MTNTQDIADYINLRMAAYNDSRQPTEDEVAICWLLSEVGHLERIIKACNRCTAIAAVLSFKAKHDVAKGGDTTK